MIMTAFTRRKRLITGAVAAAALGLGALVTWRTLRLSELLEIGAGYSAQQTCACIFISGRPLASCTQDLDPLAQRLISVQVGPDEVKAHAFGLGTAIARYERNFGCSLRN